ncbi:MAG: PorT family protein [Bacteroidales bacterium]|nr:PorT family protein [Bacteroidales bacterium]
MKLFFNNIILLISFLLLSANVSAQNDCALNLKNAQKLYTQGVIEEIPSLLNPCLEEGFNTEDKIQAYKLLILTYLFDDKKDLAEETMLKFLKTNPEYKVNPAIDPAEFIFLFNSYYTKPVLEIGVTAALNYSFPFITKLYGPSNVSQDKSKYKSSGMGFQIGPKIVYHISDKYDVGATVIYSQRQFELTSSLFDFSKTILIETQKLIEVPVVGYYKFEFTEKIKPYVLSGLAYSYLFDASYKPVRQYIDNSHNDVSGSDFSLKEFRRKNNVSIVLGAGARYKIPNGNIFFNIKYSLALLNQVNADNRLSDFDFISRYYSYDSNFNINNLTISVGFLYSIFNHKKIK